MVEAFRPRQQETSRDTEGELPESKIFDLLSSVGNGENKALELIVMKQNVIYSQYAFYREVMDHQADDLKWEIGEPLPFNHCKRSLSPIGLVTREALSPDGTAWGYQITDYGVRTGVPFAGLLLKWSYEHPGHSLYGMWSVSNSSAVKNEQSLDKKRAQETRYRIFKEIITNQSNRRRRIDVASAINEEPDLIGPHLKSLSDNDVIYYDVAERGKSYSRFRLKEYSPDQEPKQYRTNRRLSTRVFELLNYEYLSVEEIVMRLVKEYPEYENLNRSRLSSNIAGILTHFEKQNYTEREKFDYARHTEITVSEQQKEAIESLITHINKFKNGDMEVIEEGVKFAQRVANDPSLYSELMLKAKEASPNANRTSSEILQSFLISILNNQPNSARGQIQEILDKIYSKKLSKDGINRNLRSLVRKGKIVAEKIKSGNVYRVAEADKETVPFQN